jgi:hypothetical protein
VGSSVIRSVLPGWQAVRLREEFSGGLADWAGAAGTAMDWSRGSGKTRPGKLRLWTPSLNLADYQLEFEGAIEKKALGWTFRSGDLNNYYGSKLAVTRSGQATRLEIVRFVMMDGRQHDRINCAAALGLTVHIPRGSGKGSRFITSINGQVVNNWTVGGSNAATSDSSPIRARLPRSIG